MGLMNRHSNAAIYRAIIVRMSFHQPTIDYTRRRTTEGLSKRDIIRCLIRFLAREIYQRVTTDHRARLADSPRNRCLDLWGLQRHDESLNGLFKWEFVYPRSPWRGLSDVELATLDYVD